MASLTINYETLNRIRAKLREDDYRRPEIILRYPDRDDSPASRVLVLVDGSLIAYQPGLTELAKVVGERVCPQGWALQLLLGPPLLRLIVNERSITWSMPEQILGTIPSRSRGNVVHTVTRDNDGVIRCSCEGYRMSRREPPSCRHTLVFDAMLSSEPIRPGDAIITPPADRILTPAEVTARMADMSGPPAPDTVANRPPNSSLFWAIGSFWVSPVVGICRIERYDPERQTYTLQAANGDVKTRRRNSPAFRSWRPATQSEINDWLVARGELSTLPPPEEAPAPRRRSRSTTWRPRGSFWVRDMSIARIEDWDTTNRLYRLRFMDGSEGGLRKEFFEADYAAATPLQIETWQRGQPEAANEASGIQPSPVPGQYWISRVTSSVVRIESNPAMVRGSVEVRVQYGNPKTSIVSFPVTNLLRLATSTEINDWKRAMGTNPERPTAAAGPKLRTIVFEDD